MTGDIVTAAQLDDSRLGALTALLSRIVRESGDESSADFSARDYLIDFLQVP